VTRCAKYLLAVAVSAPAFLSSTAQEPAKVFRIGVLSPAERASTKIFHAFREGLREHGYVDGQNITIEYRLAAGDTSRLPEMAGELVRLPADVIVTDSQKAAVVAHEATRTIPIVGATLGPDPVAAGLAASLAHPGGNVTGFSGSGVELSGKRVEILKEAVPGASRVAALWNPATPMATLRATEEAARTLGLDLRTVEAAAPDDIPAAFEAAVGRPRRRSPSWPTRCSGTSGPGSSPSLQSTGCRPSTPNGNMSTTAVCSPTGKTYPTISGGQRGMSTRS